jgi:phosphate starvation-inducible protein PhoH and related proteins
VSASALDLTLEPDDIERLADLCGQFDEHLRQVERRLGVEISNRGNRFRLVGEEETVHAAGEVLRALYASTAEQPLDPPRVNLFLQEAGVAALAEGESAGPEDGIHTRSGTIRGRGPNQQRYLTNIATHDLNFGIGPAGTGKTYLAVAMAVQALQRRPVSRIMLTRPAVEAGERLGFLPGTLAQKVDPYLRPLYDALHDMLDFEKVPRLIERHVIEVAPLAFMRGRTLNDAFVILDEAQNTSSEQMKMFLTRSASARPRSSPAT